MNNQTTTTLRLLPAGIMALAVSLPIAWVGLSKLILLISSLFLILIFTFKNLRDKDKWIRTFKTISPTNYLVLSSFLMVLASIFWSTAPDTSIQKSLLQHGNLLIIPLLALHIKSKDEAIKILKIYAIGQIFIVCSTWIIFIGTRPPWAFDETTGNAVFSSYLDQSIMNAIFAAMLWHLRHKILPNKSHLTFIPILLTVVCIFYFLPGRSGHVVMFLLLCMCIWWLLPQKFKLVALAVPIILVTILNSTSDILSQRFKTVADEIQGFSQRQEANTSTGVRLDFWLTSLKMIDKNPIYGSGAGSWSNEYQAIKNVPEALHSTGNPHQEYLLWAVELGVPGIILLFAIFASIYIASRKMEIVEQRASLSVLAGIMVACLFNCALHDGLIGDHLCFLIGLCLAFQIKRSSL